MRVTQANRKVIGRRILVAVGIAAVAWFVVFLYTIFELLNAPLQPNTAKGNVIPWSNHGFIHYITNFDDIMNHGLFLTAPVILVIAFFGLKLRRGIQMFGGG